MEAFPSLETQDDLRTDAYSTATAVYADINDHAATGGLKVCKGDYRIFLHRLIIIFFGRSHLLFTIQKLRIIHQLS